MVEEKYGALGRLVVSVNPLVAVIDGFRWAIGGAAPMHWGSFFISTTLGIGLFVLGVWYFRRTERTFADVI